MIVRSINEMLQFDPVTNFLSYPQNFILAQYFE